MRTRLLLLTLLATSGMTLLTSCFIVSKDALVDETDGGVGLIGAETCGDVSAPVIQPGDSIVIDTTGMQDDESVTQCLGQWRESAEGADAFFRIQVADGEYWHFHIESLDLASAGRDPFVYVLPPSCSNGNLCTPTRASNRCSDVSPVDEHFGVRFNQSGFWYLGIDDVAPGGGRYRVSAFRPQCGDSDEIHGEACDGDVSPEQDTCTSDCHLYLPAVSSPMTGEGSVPNDDHFWAPELRVSAATPTLTISGGVRGECDPDVFRVRVPAGDPNADTVRVTLVDDDTGVCIPSPAAPGNLRIRFTDSADVLNLLGANMGGCFQVTTPSLGAGLYFVELTGGDPGTTFVYSLKVELIP